LYSSHVLNPFWTWRTLRRRPPENHQEEGVYYEESNLSGGINVDYGIAYGEGNLEDEAEQ
jgi:hypothetical protein